jgi:hypothetical protein
VSLTREVARGLLRTSPVILYTYQYGIGADLGVLPRARAGAPPEGFPAGSGA